MPSIIQVALVLEAFLNVPAIVSLIGFPAQTLNSFLPSPSSNAKFDANTIFLARGLGVLITALTPQLLLAYPNGKDSVGKRKLAYWTLSTGEVALVPLLLWEAFRETDQSKAAALGSGGLSRSFCLTAVANLVPILAWRAYVFGIKPHWFGDTEDVVEKAKKDR